MTKVPFFLNLKINQGHSKAFCPLFHVFYTKVIFLKTFCAFRVVMASTSDKGNS